MAKKKEEVAVAVVEPARKELILEGDPEAQLAFASKAANALMSVVGKKKNKVMIQGKQYLEFGDWQVLARFYGATVEIEWTKELPNGFEARALVKRAGEVISSAEGMCTRDERRWKTADDYAVRSMAQTRTSAKALRNAFGWVAELAGYSATPAEEMPYEAPVAVKVEVPEDVIAKVKNTTTVDALKAVWEEHKGLGKEFANIVTEHKKFILEVTKGEVAEIV